MNLSIFIESEPGRGQDTAISGQNYAFVFDGLGGKGGKPRTNAAGERELEAKIASTVSAKALKELLEGRLDRWSGLVRDERRRGSTPDEIAGEITAALSSALQAAAEEWNADTLPTTISGWLLFPLPDKTYYALAIWAGDSRCYTIDDRCMKLYTRDDTAENQRVDAMEELMLSGSPSISNRLGVDKEVRLNYTSFIVDHRTLLLTCSDGIYGYVPSPMHLEYYLRNLGVEDSVEQMVDVWNKFFLDSSLLQDDSATLEGIYVGEGTGDGLAEFKEMLLAPLDELEQKYIIPFPQPPELKDSDELVRSIGAKLGKNDAFRAALGRNIRRCAEKGVQLPDGFPCAGFAAGLREKQSEQARLKKRSIEEQCRLAETDLDRLIGSVRYRVPVLENAVYHRKEGMLDKFRQKPLNTLHGAIQRLMNSLFCLYYNHLSAKKHILKNQEYEELSFFEIGDRNLHYRTFGGNPYPPYPPFPDPINFICCYPTLMEDAKYNAAEALETALFDICVLTDDFLDRYAVREKLIHVGTQELQMKEQELTAEQKKELKRWLIEVPSMELKHCGGDLTLDLPTLGRLLEAAQRYRDAVNAGEDDASIFQEEIDRYVEENAAADARYLARKWFENGRVEGFELPTKLAASVQKLIGRVHDAKETRLDAFEQYRLDRLELWRQYKPGFEAWNREPEFEMKPTAGPESRPERKEEDNSELCGMEEEPGEESPVGSETEAGLEEPPSPKQRQEDAAAFPAPEEEGKEPGAVAGDEKDDDGFQPVDFEKIESVRRG